MKEVNQILSLKSKPCSAQKWATGPTTLDRFLPLWYNRWSLGDHRQNAGCSLPVLASWISVFWCWNVSFWSVQAVKMPSAALASTHLAACEEWKKTIFCFGAFSFDPRSTDSEFWHIHISLLPTMQLQFISIHHCPWVIKVWMLHSRTSKIILKMIIIHFPR